MLQLHNPTTGETRRQINRRDRGAAARSDTQTLDEQRSQRRPQSELQAEASQVLQAPESAPQPAAQEEEQVPEHRSPAGLMAALKDVNAVLQAAAYGLKLRLYSDQQLAQEEVRLGRALNHQRDLCDATSLIDGCDRLLCLYEERRRRQRA